MVNDMESVYRNRYVLYHGILCHDNITRMIIMSLAMYTRTLHVYKKYSSCAHDLVLNLQYIESRLHSASHLHNNDHLHITSNTTNTDCYTYATHLDRCRGFPRLQNYHRICTKESLILYRCLPIAAGCSLSTKKHTHTCTPQ